MDGSIKKETEDRMGGWEATHTASCSHAEQIESWKKLC